MSTGQSSGSNDGTTAKNENSKSTTKSESKSTTKLESKSTTTSESKNTTTSESKSTTTSENKGSSSDASGGGQEKSARESVGGAKEVHYGYFSSVSTPEYRSGWDAIWGEKSKKESEPRTRAKGPVELDLYFDKLPPELRDGLIEHVRKKLRRTPAGFRKLQKAGNVEWILSVCVQR